MFRKEGEGKEIRGRKESRRKRGKKRGRKGEGGAERMGKKRGTDPPFHLLAMNSETH